VYVNGWIRSSYPIHELARKLGFEAFRRVFARMEYSWRSTTRSSGSKEPVRVEHALSFPEPPSPEL
jgi:hypothetical protein